MIPHDGVGSRQANAGAPKSASTTMTAHQTNGQYYIIRIREKLDQKWAEWFDGMTISTDGDGTTLTGHLADQSALHGVIATISRLGLQLIAVNQKDPSPEQ